MLGSYEDPEVPKTAKFRLSGNKDYLVGGTVYLPKQVFHLRGNGDLSVTSKSGYIIAKRFSYEGS